MKSELNDDACMVVNEADVAAKVVDGEAILINLTSGLYYSTDKVGGLVWSMVTQGASVARIAEAVAAGYAVSLEQARRDVRVLVHELLAEGLILPGTTPVSVDVAPDLRIAPVQLYEAPKLTRFDDMADMFALDPPLPELGTVTKANC
jgi:hypothetical protein